MTSTPIPFTSFADLDDGLAAPKAETAAADIRKAAHIANGGEATFQCPSCKGSGRFRTYSGRDGGPCFKCSGKGQVGSRVIAAAKGKETKEANRIQWLADHAAEVAYINERADRWDFMRSMQDGIANYGKLTENQLAAVQRSMLKDTERKAERTEARAAAAPAIDNISAIQTLFDKATEKLVKTAIFRTVEITIKKAPMTGRNPGALYVTKTEGGEYCGKIVDGKFHRIFSATDVTEALKAVAVDPTAEAIKYARKFNACCCCGRTLVAPVSVLAVVGPVCGPRWGLDHLRMEAAAMLADEKAQEAAAQK